MWHREIKREKHNWLVQLFVFAVFYFVMMCGAAFAAQDPGAAISEIARELDLQTDLPTVKKQIRSAPSIPEVAPSVSGATVENILNGITTSSMVLYYTSIIICIIFVVVVIIILLRKYDFLQTFWRKKIVVRQAVPSTSPDDTVARMEITQSEADALAQMGRFADAMHALLIRSIIELRQRIDQSIADSLTSREIARHVALPGGGKAAFNAIVGNVEEVYFGDRPAGENDYRKCRQYFSALVQALKGRVT